MPTLIVLAGLPGTGKSLIARRLAQRKNVLWLRIDSIEQAIRDSGTAPGPIDDAGYRVGYAVAQDNLRCGRDVVADSVNPWTLTRDAWRDVGRSVGARVLEVETICTDRIEHRRRVETRPGDIAGLVLPDWQAVSGRDYQAWDRPRLTLDTSARSVEECTNLILAAL